MYISMKSVNGGVLRNTVKIQGGLLTGKSFPAGKMRYCERKYCLLGRMRYFVLRRNIGCWQNKVFW